MNSTTSGAKEIAEAGDLKDEEEVQSINEDGVAAHDDIKKLGVKDFLRDTAISYGLMWAMRFFYVRNKDERIFSASASGWWDHITDPPAVDDGDGFQTNYVTHPLVGAIQYLYYRGMGWGYWGAFLGAFVQSTLFEYTVEGTVENPSLPDLISTPVIGAPFGFLAETISDWLITRDSRAAKFAAHVVNPMRNFIHDRKLVMLNPITGSFEFSGTFTMTPSKDKAVDLSYPYFFESPFLLGRFMGLIEAVTTKEVLGGGEFIFYNVRADFPSSSGLWGLYVKISQAGIDNITVEGDKKSNGFEFANILAGGKFLMYKTRNSVLSGGMDMILPTAYKDNIQRLQTVTLYRRDFPLYLQSAFTISPYIAAASWKKGFSVQANLGLDLITNASNLEGEDVEFRIKYGAAAGLNFKVPTSPVLFVEFDGYTMPTATSTKKTDTFITSGVRFGKKFSPGIGVQFPVSGSTSDIADASFIADIQLRF
ncbi:MAG: DUF3943 domain-containing protein [Thermodesulfobacteriota bacterium]